MQAVILVGGEGTRLRPLTSTVPKPVVPLVDRPFIAFMLDWLVTHGIDDVIMSCGFLATSVRNVLGDGSAYGVRLRFVEEPDPRGTAGALKYASSMLDERFLMLNGDVLTDIDLTAELAQHELALTERRQLGGAADAPDELAHPLARALHVLPVSGVGAHARDRDQLRQLGAPGLIHEGRLYGDSALRRRANPPRRPD